MAKISRNQPCPCNSGKKYKKCCLEKEPSERSSKNTTRPASVAYGFDTVADPTGPIPPYAVAKSFERSEQFAEMKRREPARASFFWTPSRVAALETEELLTRLRKLGVDPSCNAYRVLAQNRFSAWEVSDVWRTKLRKRLSRHDKDFIGVASCELWKRYCPDRPSIEMLDDGMQKGYRFMMSGNAAQACDRWSEVWEVIRPRLRPDMRTCDSASVVFAGTQVLFDWLQDFALELHNAALDDARYADTGVQLCEGVLSQFPDESELFCLNFRADLGEFYYLAGRPQEGERVLLDLIHDHPDRAAGYARLSDILANGARPDDGSLDTDRAQKLLEDALARPVTDAADYDLEARLNDILNPGE
jgi:hypothetical protein